MPTVARIRLHAVRSPASLLVAVALVLVVSACGDDPDPEAQFCADARDFIDYQSGLGVAVFVPEETETFFTGSVERITALADTAPPTVEREVVIVRDAFLRLDQNLAEVGYDVTLLTEEQLDTSASDEASDAIDEFLAVACREEGDPFSGFADDPFAPLVLSPDEIEALEGEVIGRDAELEALVVAQLSEEFDLTSDQATCIVDGLGMSFLASFTTGADITESDSDRFVDQLEVCGVDLATVTE